MIPLTIIWLTLQCACFSEQPSEPVTWQDDPQDTQTKNDTGPETILEDSSRAGDLCFICLRTSCVAPCPL